MTFSNKVILIISSEKWGKIFLSKHHYASELARLGNTVFFLNPMDPSLRSGEIKVEPSLINDLSIITYRPFFPWILKFHATWLFDILIKIQVKKILKRINTKIDIVWDFNCTYLFNDLSVFKAGINIFHPVDKLGPDVSYKKADIGFSVSSLILQDYKLSNVPLFLINHGLSKNFESISSQRAVASSYDNRRINACYVGNLLIPSLDKELVKKLVTSHDNVDFTFIGPYDGIENNIYNDYNPEDEKFISFLKNRSNVFLAGILTSEQLVERLDSFDVFFMCYKNYLNHRSDNSHKVLEYLSTGKVVVSTPILYYEDLDLLITGNKDDFGNLFSKVVSDLTFYNSPDQMQKRKDFAKDNTYEKQIKRIERLINKYVVPGVFSS